MKSSALLALKLLILTTLSVALLGLGVFLTLNLRDEPLRPEVAQILNHQFEISEPAQQAFYYLVGLNSGAKAERAVQEGQQLWAEFERTPDGQREAFWKNRVLKVNPWELEFKGCKPNLSGCNFEDLKDHPEYLKPLQEQPEVLVNFLRLLDFGDVADLFPATPSMPSSGLGLNPEFVHRKLLLQMEAWFLKGDGNKAMATMAKMNHYMRQLLNHGSLNERLTALSHMRQNAEILRAALAPPSRLKPTLELVESFATPSLDAVVQSAYELEVRGFSHLIGEVRFTSDIFPMWTNGQDLWPRFVALFSKLPVRWALLNNASINGFAGADLAMLKHDCDLTHGHATDPECVEPAQWLFPRHLLQRWTNPVGRQVVAMVTSGMFGRHQRLALNLKALAKAKDDFRGRM